MPFRFSFGRPPAVAAGAMVATSQQLATRAGLRMLERGGNAADAAIAAAAVLSVTEPMSTGIGGDCFAIVWRDGKAEGLDAAGPAPAAAEHLEPVAEVGPLSVTVPGAVAGWAALAERHGRLGLDACLADAIDAAERGFAIGYLTADLWAESSAPPELGPLPQAGQRVRFPELAQSLRAIASDGATAFYSGRIARAICATSWLDEEDLASFRPRWVDPLAISYRGVQVLELPPPTQGVVALEALGLLEGSAPISRRAWSRRSSRSRTAWPACGTAPTSPSCSIPPSSRSAAPRPLPVAEPRAGTVYLCAVDGDRMAVSFIQSLYYGFGSGMVAPGTGIVLQNRGACFSVSGRVEPGRRPYHTIIPGMLVSDGTLLGPFGNMGGFIQAQAHMQLVSALVDDELDPQAALDRPRFKVDGDQVQLEEGLWPEADAVRRLGLEPVREEAVAPFGGGQIILERDGTLVAGSDPRKDGCAAGF